MTRALTTIVIAASMLASTACGAIRWPGGSDALIASGTLEADETVIAPLVAGAITSLPVQAGSHVNRGDVVVAIDDQTVQLQIRQAPDPATREALLLQAQDFTLRSPLSGVVTRMPAHLGEVAVPGQVLLAVSDTSTLEVTLYIRLADLGRVSVGQRLAITADPYPGRTFTGTVTSINQQAEFTPRNVQTQTDRLNLVFGVQAKVTNEDGSLKPGMPIDARFETSGSK
ncbi:MAG: HlyD family efflux transporter periplasmic adaptor subunit [Chloroflexota bacterium]